MLPDSGAAAFGVLLGVDDLVGVVVEVEVGAPEVVLGPSGAVPFGDMTLSRMWIRPLLVLLACQTL
jgi:hypothetical protein